MEAKDQELKAFAISHLMAGDSYRQVQTAVRDTYGQTVALSTLSAWANEDSETAGAISRAHLTTVANQRVRIAVKAADMLEEAIDNGTIPPGQRAITYGIGSDKLDSLLKIVQDERNTANERIMALRMQIRARPVHEIKALALTLDEGPSEPLPTEPPSPQDIRRYHHLDDAPN